MKIEKLGAGVFTIENFLTKQECNSYIKLSEEKDYEVATINAISGAEINKEIRHNDRVIFDDHALADALFLRAKVCLPATLDNW
jgi:prolyl 4-hydroxylase